MIHFRWCPSVATMKNFEGCCTDDPVRICNLFQRKDLKIHLRLEDTVVTTTLGDITE